MTRTEMVDFICSNSHASRADMQSRSDSYLQERVRMTCEDRGVMLPARLDSNGQRMSRFDAFDPELARLIRQFDSAQAYPELYAHADPWLYGDAAADRAAQAVMARGDAQPEWDPVLAHHLAANNAAGNALNPLFANVMGQASAAQKALAAAVSPETLAKLSDAERANLLAVIGGNIASVEAEGVSQPWSDPLTGMPIQ